VGGRSLQNVGPSQYRLPPSTRVIVIDKQYVPLKALSLRLLWFAAGQDDFILESTRATVSLFTRHGFQAEYVETAGAHTWENWRDYLHQFATRLFQ
jgi:enterochelin esterase-like enzyme